MASSNASRHCDRACPPALLTYLDGSVNLPFLQRAVDLLHGALAAYQDAVGAVIAEIGLDEARRFGDDTQVVHLPYADQRELLEIWRDEVDRLQEMLSYNDYARRLLAASLEPVIQIASGWVEASRSLVTLFDRAWYESVLENAFAQFPELTTFEGEVHNRSHRCSGISTHANLRTIGLDWRLCIGTGCRGLAQTGRWESSSESSRKSADTIRFGS